MKFIRSEKGQSLVEFAILSSVLIMLLFMPIDIYRVMRTRMLLSSAASVSLGSLGQLTVDNVTEDSIGAEIKSYVNASLGGKLTDNPIEYPVLNVSEASHKEYIYRRYSSDRETNDPGKYSERFLESDSFYQCTNVKVRLKYDLPLITPWGPVFFDYVDKGDQKCVSIVTPEYSRDVYVGGYE